MTQTSELVAGAEMDALVAEKVMGLHVHDWKATTSQTHSANKRYACSRCGARVWGSQAYAPERYSTLIAAAWQVVERLQERGFAMNLLVGASKNTGWRVEVISMVVDTPKRLYWRDAETAPEAICRAALAAVEA